MLNARHREAIALLLSGKTQEETALEIGVTRLTVNRWFNGSPPEFKEEYEKQREARTSALVEDGTEGVREAVRYLRGLLDGTEQFNTTKYQAARELYRGRASNVVFQEKSQVEHTGIPAGQPLKVVVKRVVASGADASGPDS